MKYPYLLGGCYESQAYTADQERTVNWIPERIEVPGGTTKLALYPTPGFQVLTITPSTQGRAHLYMSGREFVVVGNIFFEMDVDAVATFRGFVAMDSDPATISSNGDGGGQIFITSGGNGYLFVLSSNTFSQIAALNGKATMGDQLDGYFLALDKNTGSMYSSELLDGATWTTGSMFAQRNSAPDPWVSMKVIGKYIWLLGSQSSEVWFDNGDSPFPFAPHPSGLVPWGTAAPFSVAICGTSLVWLGASASGQGFVLRAQGFNPEVISTYPVQFIIGGYEEIGDAYADTYNMDGHTFYVLGFPKADATWVYDLEMQLWHERGTWAVGAVDYSIWRPRCHAFAFGEHRWLDITDGAVYRMAQGLWTDASGFSTLPIRRLRRAPAIESENDRVFYGSLELDLEPGDGLENGQGSDPQVMLRISRDGGATFGSERWRTAGKHGVRKRRVMWERLGMARRMVIEIVVSDPIPWKITNAYLSQPQSEEGAA